MHFVQVNIGDYIFHTAEVGNLSLSSPTVKGSSLIGYSLSLCSQNYIAMSDSGLKPK